MINSIKSELDSNSNIYLTDCSGLNADSTSKLRRACFKSNIKMSVVKNTLLEKQAYLKKLRAEKTKQD